MSWVRWAAIAGIVVAMAVAGPQTGAFSSMSADRGVAVSVAEDENALLAIEQPPVSVTGNGTSNVSLLQVTNRFTTPVSLRWNVTDGSPNTGPAVHGATGPEMLDSGASGPLCAAVDCGNATGVERATVTVRASSDDVSVVANRTVAVNCA